MAMTNRPHALMLAFPTQGHIKPMMQFAKIVSARGFHVTFVNTENMHEKMLKSGSIQSMGGINFETIPDGLPPQHGRTSQIDELCKSITNNCSPHFEKVIDKLNNSADVPPLSCIVYNGVMSWAQKSAKRLGIPGVSFWTASACGFNIYISMPLLVEKGYIPLKDKSYLTNGYLEDEISCIPGMPTLRIKDVPSFCHDPTNYMYEFVETQCQAALLADFMVVNTFDEIEGSIIDTLRARIPVYSIGPVLLSVAEETDGLSASIFTEETSCVKWLDSQEPHSVIFVCFGTMAVISERELVEFAWGLEASMQPFLWAIRADLVRGASAVLPVELMEKVKGRGLFVSWAPQVEVLSHPSVGGFLTHNGWNSTLESICAGVPMICWPFYAEQQINRTYVSQVWKIGISMNDYVTRGVMEEMVRKLMKGKEGEEMRRRSAELRDSSIKAVKKGGSSYNNLEKILEAMEGRKDI
ncbi:hypothetical protein SUGI_0449680 [Cryptomeria japonica]|uniref:7-deoxyloganetin glucosyltransferase n=1 Tax=Cryptomeria japonica TaxID=3369 RepID=UPI002408A339|nr:7-deoxyloganetin glucosyltransferase [Cryptomeria japonica]GLJ23723.1 hypothetical protein SUGI_0449680 [Cryptomeria japonica]